MRAAVWHDKKDIRFEDVPDPFIEKDDDVIIQVHWAGICGSDMHEYEAGPIFIPTEPHPISGKCNDMILAHEFSGEIVEIGKNVKRFSLRDRVTSDICIYCGDCFWCRRGQYNICANVAFSGLMADGGFAEYVRVPDYTCYKLPENISYEVGSITEPTAVCFHSVLRSRFETGENVAILGAGPIGMLMIQVARASGARDVFVSAKGEMRKRMALEVGASAVLDPTEVDVQHEVFEMTGGIGADVVFECVGSAESPNEALALARRGGRVVIVGVFSTATSLNFNDLVFPEKELIATVGTTGGFPPALKMASDGRTNPGKIITKKIKLRNLVQDGFERILKDKRANVKILVTPLEEEDLAI
jgi:(R,R)-butanediol dehydrogenase/meso-butanediol dehydrogenase/diacetyl reductase